MELSFAFLADAVQTTEGKFSVLGGGIDFLRVRSVPSVSAVGILAQWVAPITEIGMAYDVGISLIGPEDAVLFEEVRFRVFLPTEVANPHAQLKAFMSINLQALPLPSLGQYSFRLSLNGQPVDSELSFLVLGTEPRTPTGNVAGGTVNE